jgi:hypothetical protein
MKRPANRLAKFEQNLQRLAVWGVDDSAETAKYKAWRDVRAMLNRILLRLNAIESPINAAINIPRQKAKELNNPQLAAKAQEKFNRIFGDILSPLEMLRSNIAPIENAMEQVEVRMAKGSEPITRKIQEIEAEGSLSQMRAQKLQQLKQELAKLYPDIAEVKQVVEAIKQSLPMIQTGLNAVKPGNILAPIRTEIAKQKQALVQLEEFKSTEGFKSNPELQRKYQITLQGIQQYLSVLEQIGATAQDADGNEVSDFIDRIQTNVDRALKEDVPKLIEATKALGMAYGAKPREKAASVSKRRQLQNRLRTAAKRVFWLHYLSSRL